MWSLPSRFPDFPVALRSGEVKVSRCAEHQVFNWPTIALSGGFVCSGRGIRNADNRQCPLVLTLGNFWCSAEQSGFAIVLEPARDPGRLCSQGRLIYSRDRPVDIRLTIENRSHVGARMSRGAQAAHVRKGA